MFSFCIRNLNDEAVFAMTEYISSTKDISENQDRESHLTYCLEKRCILINSLFLAKKVAKDGGTSIARVLLAYLKFL